MNLLSVKGEELKPIVSVVIPTFNQGEYLDFCLKSVYEQSYKNFEVIIVDNHSTDQTDAVIKKYKFDNLTVIKFKNYGVIGKSRNIGIDASKGEFIAFLDSDDAWHPKKLEICVSHLNLGFDVCAHHLKYIGSMSGVLKCGPINLVTFEYMYRFGSKLVTSSVVVRKSLLVLVEGFPTGREFITSEDYFLWLKIARVTSKIFIIDEVLGIYRVHALSNSRKHVFHLRSVLSVASHFVENLNVSGKVSKKTYSKRIALAYYSAGREFYKGKRWLFARKIFYKSLLLNPINFKTYIFFICAFIQDKMIRLFH